MLGVTGAEVTITDDDERGVAVEAADPLEVAENGSATYTVVLDSEPTGEVTVTDDDVPSTTINLSVTPETVREGAGATALTVTATLDGAVLAEEVEVTLSLVSGTAQAGRTSRRRSR